MRALIIAASALLLPLSSCASLSTGEQAVATGNKVVVEGARYFLIAQDAYQAAANSAATAIRSGIWKPNEGQKLMLNSLNDNALKIIEGVDKSLTMAQRTAALMTIANQINSISGRK